MAITVVVKEQFAKRFIETNRNSIAHSHCWSVSFSDDEASLTIDPHGNDLCWLGEMLKRLYRSGQYAKSVADQLRAELEKTVREVA
jgi:hypothetical protein